jgi:hypothetical protein
MKAKVLLNVVAGLFLSFTFYEKDASLSAQGLQNKSISLPSH